MLKLKDRILPPQLNEHHTKVNYLWLSQSPPENEGTCQDLNLARLAAHPYGLLKEVYNLPGSARGNQPHTEPTSQLCPFSHHHPDLKGGEFNVHQSCLAETEDVLPLCSQNPWLQSLHDHTSFQRCRDTHTAPVHAPLKCTLHTNHSQRGSHIGRQ